MDAITIQCTACGTSMRFGADKAGRKAKCAKCGTVVIITAPEKPNGAPVETSAAPSQSIASPPPTADEVGSYGVTEVLAREAPKQEEKKKEKKRKILRKQKAIPDAELWEKVRVGLLFMYVGTWLWLAAHLLQGTYVLLGTVEFPEWTRLIVAEINAHPEFVPDQGFFWNINQLNVLLGAVSGRSFLALAWILLFLGIMQRLGQHLVWIAGYVTSLSVPDRFGTAGQVKGMLGLGVWNSAVVFLIMLLPVLGLYQYYLIPFVVPEIAMTEYNMERTLPLHVLWLASPFWECLLNIVLQFALSMEPIMGAIFVWSIGRSIRDAELEEKGLATVRLGFGQLFVLTAYHLLSNTGATPVLITVLRVVYPLWYAFLLLFILQYAALLGRARAILYRKINPENEAD